MRVAPLAGSRSVNETTSPIRMVSIGFGRITTSVPTGNVGVMLGESTVSAEPPAAAGTTATASASATAASSTSEPSQARKRRGADGRVAIDALSPPVSRRTPGRSAWRC